MTLKQWQPRTKDAYVRALRQMREVLSKRGLLEGFDDWAESSQTRRWIRSLLAVYDLDDLVELDLPWWTLSAEARVDSFLSSRERPFVFEWGAGASTIWLGKRACRVTSIEHDADWAERVAMLALPNTDVRCIPPTPSSRPVVSSQKPGFRNLDFGRYVQAIKQAGGPYDLIVIDGRAREACLGPALQHLAPGGVIVFDNLERHRYRRAVKSVHMDLDVSHAWGATVALPYPTCTGLLRTRDR